MTTKTCTRCSKTLPVSSFQTFRDDPTKTYKWCISCVNEVKQEVSKEPTPVKSYINPDEWTYHKPTEVTAPIFAEIRRYEAECRSFLTTIQNQNYEKANKLVLEFATYLDQNCPRCQDTTAAIRELRLVRNAFNEIISQPEMKPILRERFCMLAWGSIIKARWLACSAVANWM